MSHDVTSAVTQFWRPGFGAIHRAFASPEQVERDGYIARLAETDPLTEIWTNSLMLADSAHYMADTAALLTAVQDITEKRSLDISQPILGPAADRPVVALILEIRIDLTVAHVSAIEQIIMQGRVLAVSVTLIVPGLAPSIVGSLLIRSLLAREPAGLPDTGCELQRAGT
jgi:hypothetical protein